MSQPDTGIDRRYRVRRQRRATVTLAIVLLALAGAFYYASSYFTTTTPVPQACTTTIPVQVLQPRDVSIRVFNATSKRGLATATSKVAAQRGFTIKEVGNDPLDTTVKGVGQLRYGPTGAASAKLLATHIRGITLVPDKRQDDTVDLVLGNGWKAFGPVPKVVTVTPTAQPCAPVTVTVPA